MAKKAKNDGGGFDRIGQFPDEILCRILSSLPTDEAVRTSVLSSRWRYVFTCLSSFDVDISRLLRDRISRVGFAQYMVRMLYFRSESLEHFRLKRIKDCYLHFGRLFDWICAALYRNVEELELHISDWDCDSLDDFEGLPPDLYICKSLVKLKLAIPFRLDFPDNVSLSNLKIMELHKLLFPDPDSDVLQKLLSSSSCPVLEDLTIYDCHIENQLNISNQSLKRLTITTRSLRDGSSECLVLNVPSLVYLNYVDFEADVYSIAEMRSLVKADIRFSRKDYQPAFAQLLQGVHHAKSFYLSIHHEVLAFLSGGNGMPSLAFSNLVRLEILYDYQDWQATGLYEFLEFSPNLQTLVLSNANFDVSRPPPKEVPSCLLAHLKEIEISEFRGDIHLLEMIAYFLLNARVLEKLTIHMNCLEEQKRFCMTNQVLSLPRSSRNCQVVTDIS